MPLIQGGPPEWIWERTADPLRWEVVPSRSPQDGQVYELRVNCGLGIMRLHYFKTEEMRQLQGLIADTFSAAAAAEKSA